jgi:uncharacterized protein DUF3768
MSNTDNGKLCSNMEQNSNRHLGGPGCENRTEERTTKIRVLNDRLRTEGRGGMIHMTNGVAALGLATVNTIFKTIAAFSAFTPDNDPWGEHDCAVMDVEGHRLIWKIDYYDRSRSYHSPDAADPKVTVRVMTVMLAEEY